MNKNIPLMLALALMPLPVLGQSPAPHPSPIVLTKPASLFLKPAQNALKPEDQQGSVAGEDVAEFPTPASPAEDAEEAAEETDVTPEKPVQEVPKIVAAPAAPAPVKPAPAASTQVTPAPVVLAPAKAAQPVIEPITPTASPAAETEEQPAAGMTLEEALVAAYENNPTLKAERKSMEGAFEALPKSYAAFLPTLSENLSDGLEHGHAFGGREQASEPHSQSLNLSEPLFRGGKTYSEIERAQAIIKEARANLVSAEQKVFTDAMRAYFNVIETRQIDQVNEHNQETLEEQLKVTRNKFKLGEATHTDQAQAESRLAQAKSDKITAHGNKINAESEFRRVFQIVPEKDLAYPEAFPAIPESLDAVMEKALSNNPDLLGADYRHQADKKAIRTAEGSLLPSASLNGSLRKQSGGGVGQFEDISTETLTVNVTVPLYQGGGEYSDVRRARKNAKEDGYRLAQARQDTVSGASQAWESLATTKGALEASKVAVSSAQIALDSIKQEQQYGTRTVQDVLDQERELFQSQVNQATAERNLALAAYNLKATMGELTAEGLNLPVVRYDPQKIYDKIKYRFIGF